MLVALEGIDGAGKGTQAVMLADRAAAEGLSVAHFAFPRYGDNPFAEAVSWYLNGQLGDRSRLDARLVSLLYAGDRLLARGPLDDALRSHDLVVIDRYSASNLAYQAAVLEDAARESFAAWLDSVEHGSFGLARADLVVLLDLPAELSLARVRSKQPRAYTRLGADANEADEGYLERVRRTYLWLAKRETTPPFHLLPCVARSGRERGEAELAAEVWAVVRGAGGW